MTSFLTEEKTRHFLASPLIRKKIIFKEPDPEAEDDNITSRKPLQPTVELKNNKSKGEELEMCSKERAHEQKKSVIEVLSDDDVNSNETKVTATVHEDENMDDSQSNIWCLKAPNGEPKKFRLSVLKTWSETNPYASKFKVWKEGGDESNAVWLKEVLSKK